MIFKKHSILLILALYLCYALCNNNAFTSQDTTVSISTEFTHSPDSVESFASTTSYNTDSTENVINVLDYDSESMENLADFTHYASELTEESLRSTTSYTNLHYTNDESARNFTTQENVANITSYNPESTEDFTSYSSYESTITTPYESTEDELLTSDQTDITDDLSSYPSTTDDFTETTLLMSTIIAEESTTIPNDSTNDTTCDPTWPVNANDTKEVVDLKIEKTSTEWISLSWESPCKDANVSIVYSIQRCEDKNCIEINESTTYHIASDLQPCTHYTFHIKVITEFWESNGVTRTATTNRTISEIGNVQHLDVHNTDVNSIQLMWQAPTIHTNCVSNYSIIQCDEKSCNETTVFAENYIANNLDACTHYHFTVKTMAEAVQSAGVNVTAKTTSPNMMAPESLRITPGYFSLTVNWKPPRSGSTCLKHYRVSVHSSKINFNTTKTSVKISDLNACTSYKVYINAVNEDNVDGEMISKSSTTSRSKTNPPLSYTSGALVTANSISILWSVEKYNNHCPLLSIITVCNYTASNGTGYELVNGISVIEIDPKNANASVVNMNITVAKLSPFTSYTCWAYTANTAGLSELSNGVNTKTMEDVPSPPTFHVTNITNSQFSLIWKSPEYLAGNLEDFEITFVWEPLYPIPDWCSREITNIKNITQLNATTFRYDYLKAKPFTNYTVMMRAKTTTGWGSYSTPQIFQSHHAVPEAVSKFSHTIKENPTDTNILDTILTWGLPCSLNGELEVFNISVYGVRDGYAHHSFFIMDECADYIYHDYMCSINLKELKGEYNYTFTVSTKIMNVNTFGPEISEDNILYPAGIPLQPEDEYIKSITIDPYKARRSTTTAAVLLPLFPDNNGDIKYYAIMVSEMGCNSPSSTRFDLQTKIWPNASSWEESMMSDFLITYQATRPKWDPYPNYVADYGHMKAVKYVIGEDTTCKEISSNTDKRLYCNGPLKPDTWYHIRMRAFTYGGYTDSVVFVIKTNAELNVAIVIGIVFGILFLGILTTMMLLVRKCSPYIVLRRFLHSDMPGSPVPAPFTRKKFIAHCQQLIDNPGKLSNEFRLLQTLSVDLQMPTNTACLQANRKKNRYSDILPYDFSRVKLEVIDNDPNTDYINASFIRGYTGEDEYIACQGPKEQTTYDFWRMVDQYNVNIIVMLTQLVEKGKEKCHQYYPTIRETFRYENMTIRCTSELDFRTHTQRTLVLQKENKKRSITHLHFKDWPDHDVPEDFDPMINFCQIMRRNINANQGFVVVHCSAGIGRTGTLIAIDILLQHLRDNRKLDVFGTVYRLRHHRINMVQRESQYAYIYNCIKQVLKNPYFLKTYKPPPVDPVYENIPKKAKDSANSDTNLVNNFEILKKYNFSISMDSLESVYNLFPWSNTKHQRSKINSGMRHYKSMSAINVKTHHISLGKSTTLGCIFSKSRKDSSYQSCEEGLTEENYPLLPCSRSVNVLNDSMQYVTDSI